MPLEISHPYLLMAGIALTPVCLLVLAVGALAQNNVEKRAQLLQSTGWDKPERQLIAGFFHPFSSGGAGGERVLWKAITQLQRDHPEVMVLLYTGDFPSGFKSKEAAYAKKDEVIKSIQERFGITLDPVRITFAGLASRDKLKDDYYKRARLLRQSIAGAWLAYEGLRDGMVPDMWIDTMGCAFAYPLVCWFTGVPIASYTHYPTVSSDMMARVKSRKAGHTNDAAIASSTSLSTLKLWYYAAFVRMYKFALRRADIVMVNSTWTKAHVDSLMGPGSGGSRVVYPPCDTEKLSQIPLDNGRENVILSVAQFRPEKEHMTQLEALKLVLASNADVKLVMAGSVRDKADEERVEALKRHAKKLGVDANVEFVVNAPYDELVSRHFSRALIGLHTMVDEHFGITVVDFMAAGLVPIVHASGGPMLDIVDAPSTGLHAKDAQSFADAIKDVLAMPQEARDAMRRRARERACDKFKPEVFERGFEETWQALCTKADAQNLTTSLMQ